MQKNGISNVLVICFLLAEKAWLFTAATQVRTSKNNEKTVGLPRHLSAPTRNDRGRGADSSTPGIRSSLRMTGGEKRHEKCPVFLSHFPNCADGPHVLYYTNFDIGEGKV